MTINDFRDIPVFLNSMSTLKQHLINIRDNSHSDQNENYISSEIQQSQIQIIEMEYEKAYMLYVQKSAEAEEWFSKNSPNLLTEAILRFHYLLGYTWKETAEHISRSGKVYSVESCRKIVRNCFEGKKSN